MQCAPSKRLEVRREAVALGDQLVGHLGVDVVEHAQRLRVGQRLAALAQRGAELVGLGLDLVEEVGVGQAVALEVGLDPGDRVLELPALDVAGEPVAGRVVGRGVRAHPVGVGLDERRALPVAGPLQRGLRDGVRRQHVVAVDPDAGEAEAQGALVERDPGLALDRLGDRPLVVLAEEHDRGVVGRGEDERLVDVALAGGAVAEVGDDGRVAVGVAGADDAVALHAHRVAGGVQGLRADDDRVEAEVVVRGVPAAVVDAAEQAEQLERVDAAAPGDAVLAVGREDEVLRAQRAAGADLRGLLAEQLGPDAELAVALQRGGLGVDAADQDHVAVEAAQLARRRGRGRSRGAGPARPRASAAGPARGRRRSARGRRPRRDRVRKRCHVLHGAPSRSRRCGVSACRAPSVSRAAEWSGHLRRGGGAGCEPGHNRASQSIGHDEAGRIA